MNPETFREGRFGMWQPIENKAVPSSVKRPGESLRHPEKSCLTAAFFVSTPLFSEYQLRAGFLPVFLAWKACRINAKYLGKT
jgi:hypothetical protein